MAKVATGVEVGSGALLRLLHLASPALPVGAFAYSQGLEQAVALGWVCDEATASDWILGLAAHALGTLDVPVLRRLQVAWSTADALAVARWNDFLYASRGARELQDEDRRMAVGLARVLLLHEIPEAEPWTTAPRATFGAVFALAAARFELPEAAAAEAFLFAWCENQVAAAMRLVPLGQSSGQRILAAAMRVIPAIASRANALGDDEIGASAPAHAMASAWHETLYSRIFRS